MEFAVLPPSFLFICLSSSRFAFFLTYFTTFIIGPLFKLTP